MHLTLTERRRLFIETMARAIASMVNKGRAKPQATAHRAYDFALASVTEVSVRARVRKAATRSRK